MQLAIPTGSEDLCRRFYCDVLGLLEIEKPEVLARSGGLWLALGMSELHLGVEKEFLPAKKAHPGIQVTDVVALADHLKANGCEIEWDHAIPTLRRFYVFDFVGNRLEFLQPVEQP
ncbi:VOC family protein [Rhizobium brockwellii]|uniref:VOC family protein n=1 Tax=Rhizobium brockwellii TaxID=3019932 RepID=UPI003F9B423B